MTSRVAESVSLFNCFCRGSITSTFCGFRSWRTMTVACRTFLSLSFNNSTNLLSISIFSFSPLIGMIASITPFQLSFSSFLCSASMPRSNAGCQICLSLLSNISVKISLAFFHKFSSFLSIRTSKINFNASLRTDSFKFVLK